MEVVDASLQPEIGTGGKPRRQPYKPEKVNYRTIDLYSEEVLAEEILF